MKLLLITALALFASSLATAGTIFIGLIRHGVYYVEPNKAILYSEFGLQMFLALFAIAVVLFCAKKFAEGSK